MTPRFSRGKPLVVAGAMSLALIASACGGGTSTPASPEAGAAISAADQNQGNLQQTDDIRTIQVLNVSDGSSTTLNEVVTGDRAVLLWFYAPH